MRKMHRILLPILPILITVGAFASAETSDSTTPAPPTENKCLLCHGNKDVWEGEQLRLFISEADFAADIHWQRGLRCKDCHGGNDQTDELRAAHAEEDGFHTVKSPADVPKFCGDCHANIEYMRRYRPSPRTDQLTEYWTSDHGQRLKATGDPDVATCISCHDKPHGSAQDKNKHGIRLVTDLESPVYRTRVAKTCATCHSDQQRMKGRLYNGQPLSCDEYSKWRQSVHGKAMMEKGDLSAATCNNCHGNHGAVPPLVGSVANACGTCHGKVAKLFDDTRMKHKFEEVGLPGCVTCHGNHDIKLPSDEMLGMEDSAVCARCHENGKYGATLAGAQAARTLHSDLEQLKNNIDTAEKTLNKAERLGMEISQPRFELRAAFDALTNARSLVHTFQIKPVQTAVAGGEKISAEVQEKADHALQEHTARRIWLATTLVPILLVIALLLLYIRSMPVLPNKERTAD
jgi:predicted CXXCH cytochrome family protein